MKYYYVIEYEIGVSDGTIVGKYLSLQEAKMLADIAPFGCVREVYNQNDEVVYSCENRSYD